MPLSISTVNVNGIRAAVKHRSETNRGFLPWLEDSSLDVVLLQEVRASEDLARDALAPALDAGWHLTMSESAVKGHAGVGVLTRSAPRAPSDSASAARSSTISAATSKSTSTPTSVR